MNKLIYELLKYLKPKKRKVLIFKLLKKTTGKRHAWYETNVGIIRKQITNF